MFCSWVCAFEVCGPSQFSAGPWQLSQLTPSLTSNSRPCSAGETFKEWQSRQRGALAALGKPNILAMCCETALFSTFWAFECLSCSTHVLYSFCSTLVSCRAATEPWQAVALHDPGPTYLP